MAEETAREKSLEDISAELYADLDEDEDEEGEFDARVAGEYETDEDDAPSAEADEPDSPKGDPPEDAEADPVADEGQPRGPDGKFIPKAPTPDAAAPPPSSAPAPTGPPAAPEAAPTPPPPFTVRAGGREHALDGVTRQEDGSLMIAADHAARVTHLLQRGVHHETSWASEYQEMQKKLQAKDDETEKGRLITRHLMGLMEKGPEAVAEWLDEFESNRERLMLEVEKERLAQERESLLSGQSAEQEQRQQAEITAWVEQSIPTEVQEVAAQFQGVFAPEDLQRIGNRVSQIADRVFLIADRDFTASEMAAMGFPEMGAVQRGERFVRSDMIESIVKEEASVIQRERARAAEVIRKAQDAVKANARNQGARRAAPPAVGADHGAEEEPDSPREPKDMSEWQNSLLAEIR